MNEWFIKYCSTSAGLNNNEKTSSKLQNTHTLTCTHTCTLIDNKGNANVNILQFNVIKLRYKLLVYNEVYLLKQYC